MLDLYKERLRNQGSYIGDVLKNQSDMIMDKTFENDVACKKCYINSNLVLAKVQKNVSVSIDNNRIDYLLQFKTGVHYPIGTYINIPDDTGIYHTWLIVGKDDDPQFVKYNVLKCNKELKWIYKGTIFSCLGVLLDGSEMSVKIGDVITVPESGLTFWVPNSQDTQTISYDIRFILDNNNINPLSYITTGIKYSFPEGIIKVKLSQDQYNPVTDNLDLMIADYYKSTIIPTVPIVTTSKITCNGTSPTLKLGGSYKTLTATFYDMSGNAIDNVAPIWSYEYPDNLSTDFEKIEMGKQVQIRALKDYDLIGKVLTVNVTDISGNYTSSIQLEVVVQ